MTTYYELSFCCFTRDSSLLSDFIAHFADLTRSMDYFDVRTLIFLSKFHIGIPKKHNEFLRAKTILS